MGQQFSRHFRSGFRATEPPRSLEDTGTRLRMIGVNGTSGPEDSATNFEQGDTGRTTAANIRLLARPPCQASVKLKQLRWKICFWILMLPLTVLLFLYVYEALLAEPRHLGHRLLPADENVVVSVLSQSFAQLTDAMLKDVPDALRWQLASRPLGVSLPMFLQLNAATGLGGSIMLSTQWGKHLFWTVHRLALPLLSIFLGNILKYHANFENRYVPTSPSRRVFAGLAAMDRRVLNVVPTSVFCIYFIAWMPSLLGVSQYVIGQSAADCSNNCTLAFLPGGFEMARVRGQNLNTTLLEGGYFNDADAVLLNDVPGIGVKFEQPSAHMVFDLRNDCDVYGQELGDGIKICIRSEGSALLVGWTICPSAVYQNTTNHTCSSTGSWTENIDQKTMLTAYWQNATTAYARQNLSILNVDMNSPPQPYKIDPPTFKAIWSKLLEITNTTSSENLPMMKSFMFQLGWYLRLYQDNFHDDQQSPLSLLQNFLTIPLLFSTTALQWSNATCQDVPEQLYPRLGCDYFPMPENLQTTASAASIILRFKGQRWIVAVFMAVGSLALLWPGCILIWIILQKFPLDFNPSGLVDIDAASLSGNFAQLVRNVLPSDPGLSALRRFIRLSRLYVEKKEDGTSNLCGVNPTMPQGPLHEDDADENQRVQEREDEGEAVRNERERGSSYGIVIPVSACWSHEFGLRANILVTEVLRRSHTY